MCWCTLHATRPPWRSESAFAAGTQWMKAAAAPLSVPALQNVFSCCFAQVRCSLGAWKKKTVTHHSPPAWAKPLRERHRRMSPLKSKFIITPPYCSPLVSILRAPFLLFLSLSFCLFCLRSAHAAKNTSHIIFWDRLKIRCVLFCFKDRKMNKTGPDMQLLWNLWNKRSAKKRWTLVAAQWELKHFNK